MNAIQTLQTLAETENLIRKKGGILNEVSPAYFLINFILTFCFFAFLRFLSATIPDEIKAEMWFTITTILFVGIPLCLFTLCTIGFFVYNVFHKTSPMISSFKNLYLTTFFRWRASKKLPKILHDNFKELYEFYKKEGILFHFESVYNQVQNHYNGKALQSFYYYSKNLSLPSEKDNNKTTDKKPQTSYAQLFKNTCNQSKEQKSTDVQSINFFPKEITK